MTFQVFTQKCLLSFENKTTENFEVDGVAIWQKEIMASFSQPPKTLK